MITDYLLAMRTGNIWQYVELIHDQVGFDSRDCHLVKTFTAEPATALTTAYNYVEKLLLHRM